MSDVLRHLEIEQAPREHLERQIAMLTAQNDTLTDVVYSLSHDLKEPSRNTNLALGLLARQLNGKLNTKDGEILNLAVSSAARMLRMLEEMLAYCRSDRETGLIEHPIADLIAVARENVASQIEDSGTQFLFENLPVVRCRRIPMIQLFQNLFANAIKFRGKDSPCISIEAHQDNEEWLFSVRDNGRGFPQSSREKVFNLFSQLNPDSDGSSGIGLALCKKIVESHGGRIWAESKVAEGSTFFFTIPSNRPD